jgi:hypothetical protein
MSSDIALSGKNELAVAHSAATAKSEIEASFTMAMHRPRNVLDARDKMLESSQRKGFAEAALYKKPLGGNKHVVGMSIRAAEELARLWGNIRVVVRTSHDDDEKRILSVTTIDLETNMAFSSDVTVEKILERSRVKEGQIEVKPSRMNTSGKPVFFVRPTEDEMTIKQNALVSKAIRNNVLRLIPADIKEEITMQIQKTLKGQVKENLAEQRKKIADAFSSIGVKPSDLESYLKHSLGSTSPQEIVDLRATFQAIKDGEATWASVITPPETDGGDQGKNKKPRTKTTAEKLAEKNKTVPVSPQEQPTLPTDGIESLKVKVTEGIGIIGDQSWECIRAEEGFPKALNKMTEEQLKVALRRIDQKASEK